MPFDESNDEIMATQVGDCSQCNTLFTLPVAAEPFDTIRCPDCNAVLSLDSISMRKVQVAEAISSTPVAAEESEPSQGQESLEDWLKRTTGVSLSTPGEVEPKEEIEVAEEADKSPQNQTMDWNPGSINLETPEETIEVADTNFQLQEEAEVAEDATHESMPSIESLLQQAEQQLAESEEQVTGIQSDPKDDEPTAFKLPEFELSEESENDMEATVANDFLTREEERQEELQEVIEDHVEPADIANRLELVHENEHPRNRWGGPVSALAGLLVVGGVSYVIFSNQFSSPEEATVAQQGNIESVSATDDQTQNNDTPSAEESTFAADDSEVVPDPTSTEVAQATFNEPASSEVSPDETNQASSSVGDRYAQDASSVDEPNLFMPPAEQKTLPMQRLVGAPSYSAKELQEATNYSESIVKQLLQTTSMEGADRDQALGKHYAELCYLAQVVSLLDLKSDSQGLKTTEMMAVELYKKLFYEDASIEQINQVAKQWIQWIERPYGGVFLSGIPDDMQYAGELIQYRMPLGDSHVMIVTEEPINVDRYVMSDSQRMGIIGIVIEDPAERITGYEGDAEQVIWCRKTIPVGEKPWAR